MPRVPLSMRHAILIPLIVACALFMENMDSTVISTSLPAIAADVGEPPLALKLALTSYLVSLAVFIPISGWVADKRGARTVFASAIVTFVAGSLLCAVSSTLAQFVAARFLQGIGGAMMVPVGRLVLMRSIPKHEYVSALSYLTIPALLGPVIGPALGGAITLYFHWRWIFLINLPIGALGLYLVLRHIPDVREEENPPFDLPGFALSGLGMSVLMLGLSALGGHLMPMEAAGACIVVGTLCLVAYGWHATRTAHPVVNLRLFRLPTFRSGVLYGSLFRMGLGATPFILPLLMQVGFGLDPLQSGLLTCVSSIGAMFTKTLSVRILRRFGFRSVLTVNGVAAAFTFAVFALFTASTPHAVMVVVLLLSGCLRSMQFTALNAVVFADIGPREMSQAASISSMVQRLAQSLGIALAAYVLQITSIAQGHEHVVAADFPVTFIALALLGLGAPLLHLKLAPDAGVTVSGHRRVSASD
jgi:EmrB/QacA subfamily drug resistance transporter